MNEKHEVDRGRIEAEENLVIDMQFCLQDALNRKKITRAELSRRTGFSQRKLSNLMKAGADPSLKTIAAIFDALELKVKIAAVRKPRQKASP